MSSLNNEIKRFNNPEIFGIKPRTDEDVKKDLDFFYKQHDEKMAELDSEVIQTLRRIAFKNWKIKSEILEHIKLLQAGI